jgi:hypothetical protein
MSIANCCKNMVRWKGVIFFVCFDLLVFFFAGCILFRPPIENIPTKGVEISALDFLLSNKRESAGFAAYSYIFFTRRPISGDSVDSAKFLELYRCCRSVFANISEIERYTEKRKINVTNWPIRAPSINVAYQHVNDAAYCVQHYDFDRAFKLRSVSFPKLNKEGPYIVSVSHPLSVSNTPAQYFVIDLTGQNTKTYIGYLYYFQKKIKEDSVFIQTGAFPDADEVVLRIKSMIANIGDFTRNPEVLASTDYIIKLINTGLNIATIFRGRKG